MIDELNESDFVRLKYNPFKNTDVAPRKQYPELDKAWKNYVITKEAQQFICVFYDIHNPFQGKAGDRIEQKKTIGLLCKWPTTSEGYFESYYHDIITGVDHDFNMCVINFVKMFHSASYYHLVTQWQTYDNIKETLNDPSINKGNKGDIEIIKLKAEVVTKLDSIYKTIRETEIEMLQDDIIGLRKDLFKVIQEDTKRLNLSPESRINNQ